MNLTDTQLADVGRLALDAARARRERIQAKQARNDAHGDWRDTAPDPDDEDAMKAATAREQAAYRDATKRATAATQRLRRRLELLGVFG